MGTTRTAAAWRGLPRRRSARRHLLLLQPLLTCIVRGAGRGNRNGSCGSGSAAGADSSKEFELSREVAERRRLSDDAHPF